jgi:heme/copper-type cytochrome/quinol oxidase subunit 2
LDEVLEKKPPTERFKKPKTRIILESLWSFWLNRWTVIIPIFLTIIGIMVALFIHFDPNPQSKTTHKKSNTK